MSRRTLGFVLAGLLVSLLLAGVVSNLASSDPDGLDSATLRGCTVVDGKITGGDCPAKRAGESEVADGPLAGYGVAGLDDTWLSTGLSGVVGVLVTFGVGGGLFWLMRRRRPADETAADPT
jgi:cobalt/nickel transport protein